MRRVCGEMCLCGGACAGGDGWRPRGGGRGGGRRECIVVLLGRLQVRRVVLFPALHLRAAGWDHPTLPVLGLLLLFFLALFSPHRNHAVEGRKERTTAPWWEKGATPSYPHAIQDQANRSRSFSYLCERPTSVSALRNSLPSILPRPWFPSQATSLTLSADEHRVD